MRRSKVEIYVHLVWATARRRTVLSGEVERAAHRCIHAEAQRLKCKVLAVNGMPDHVHLLVQIPSSLSIAKLAQSVKGVSSTMLRQNFSFEDAFDWQDNYAAFSISRSHVARVKGYIQNQKQHHAAGKVWAEWEETDEVKPTEPEV